MRNCPKSDYINNALQPAQLFNVILNSVKQFRGTMSPRHQAHAMSPPAQSADPTGGGRPLTALESRGFIQMIFHTLNSKFIFQTTNPDPHPHASEKMPPRDSYTGPITPI